MQGGLMKTENGGLEFKAEKRVVDKWLKTKQKV